MTYFTESEKKSLDPAKIPHHVAFIPDGNRRWAKAQTLNVGKGHEKGVGLIMDTILAAKELGVKAVTFYAFSTENWRRPQEEVDLLLWLAELFLIEELPKMMKEGVRLRTMGDLSKLSPQLQKTFAKTKEATLNNSQIDFVIAMNYGARDEITRAVKSIGRKIKAGEIHPDEVTEECISHHLDSHPIPDPDLLIRTSGENRISNFLLWQLSYSEIYFSPLKWPEFDSKELLQAVKVFQDRERRQGL